MPRYEFSEGSSNKFWDIKMEGSAVITTYGKIGTDGQSTMKEYDSPEQARKEYDKLIASKVKKGYQPAGGGGQAAAAAPAKKASRCAPKAESAAKAEKPAKKAAPAGGKQHYEFSEGSSNKFWEIKLEGSSVITTYGKIGTDGQSTMKEYDSPEQAQKEHDKLVVSKVKKGYAKV